MSSLVEMSELVDIVEFHIYTDGSGGSSTGGPAWAFVILAWDSLGQQALLGFEGGALEGEHPSNLLALASELQGAQWALAWFLQSPYASLTHEIAITVYSDCMEVLRVAQGGALSPSVLQLRSELDSLAKVVSYFTSSTRWAHVLGHSGDPWNEFVDTISTLVSTGKGSIPIPDSSWRVCLQYHVELSWLWLKFEPVQVQQQYPAAGAELQEFSESPLDKATALFSLLKFAACDTSAKPATAGSGTSQVSPSSSTLSVAAANVLSLDPLKARVSRKFKPVGLFMSGRMKHLGTVFLKQGFFLVGTVETRFPRSGTSTIKPYHVVHAKCDDDRKFGCSLWVNSSIQVAPGVKCQAKHV